MKSQDKRDQALDLFLEGKSIREIAKAVEVNKDTITEWKKKYNWEILRKAYLEEMQTELILKSAQSEAEFKSKAKELTYKAVLLLLARMQYEPRKLENRELVAILKFGLDIYMPRTQAQFNFMKQEINKGVFYKFEVDDGANNNKAVEKTRQSISDIKR